jgi:Domain of unknown function (DUF4169)
VSELVNLRLARKRKAREEADRQAAERRAKYGRTKAEVQAQSLRVDIAERALDGHRRATIHES